MNIEKKKIQLSYSAIDTIKPNPNNPRTITGSNYAKLRDSIKEFPNMLWAKPIVVSADNVVLAGNMRLQACRELGMTYVPTLDASFFSDSQLGEFMIKDNTHFGEFDYDALSNQYEFEVLDAYGVQFPNYEVDNYTPEYEPVFDTSEVTREQIEEKARELADKMVREMKMKDIMCPECGAEFNIPE